MLLNSSRDALERTLRQRLIGGLAERYYLAGTAQSLCWVHSEDAEVSFSQDRIIVRF
jgi:hypothetical protein